MKALVLDGSTALGFVLRDDGSSHAMKALEAVESGTPSFVPAHWCVEVANGLMMAERRKRTSQAETAEAMELIASLPIVTDDQTALRIGGDTAGLARQYGLTIYDAAYLELAMRRGAALATTDRALVAAAKAVGVALFG